jgi:hypothetical protein
MALGCARAFGAVLPGVIPFQLICWPTEGESPLRENASMSNDQPEEKADKPDPPGHPDKHEIFINEVKHDVDADSLSGAQLRALAGVPADYQLFLEQPGDDKPIADGDSVKLKNGMKFYTLPPATFG